MSVSVHFSSQNTKYCESKVDTTKGALALNILASWLPPTEKNKILRWTMERIIRLEPETIFASERTFSPEDFFRDKNVTCLTTGLTSEDIEELYKIIDSHPRSQKLSFHNLFVLEFLKLCRNFKVSKANEKILEQSWKTWQSAFMQSSFVSCSEKSTQNLDSTRKFSQLFNLMGDLLGNDAASPNFIKIKNYQTIINKVFAYNHSYNILFKTIDRCAGVVDTLKVSEDDMKSAVNQVQKLAMFLKVNFNNLEDNDQTLFGTFNFLSETIDQLCKTVNSLVGVGGDEKTQELEMITDFSYEIVDLLVAIFLFIHSNDNNIFNKKFSTITSSQKKMLEFCTFWIIDFMKIFQQSVLPFLNKYYHAAVAYEKRLNVNLIVFNNCLNDFGAGTRLCFPTSNGSAKQLENISNELFDNLMDLHDDFKKIVGWGVRCQKLNVQMLPFQYNKLTTIYAQLKPIVKETLKKLSVCAKNNPDQLAELPLLKFTTNIALVLVLMHDLKKVLNKKNSWPCELPKSYLKFLALEKLEASTESPISEGEGLDEMEVSSDSKTSESSLSASMSSLEISSPSSTAPTEPSLSDDEGFDCKGISLRHLNRAMRQLGLKELKGRGGGKRHTKWVDSEKNFMTMGPRHGKNPGRGLVKAMQEQVFQNAQLVKNRKVEGLQYEVKNPVEAKPKGKNKKNRR